MPNQHCQQILFRAAACVYADMPTICNKSQLPSRHAQLLCRVQYNTESPRLQDFHGTNVVRLLQHAQEAGILQSCLCIVKCKQTIDLLYQPENGDITDVECIEHVATASGWQTAAGGSIAWNQVKIGSADTVLQARSAAPFVALPVEFIKALSFHTL